MLLKVWTYHPWRSNTLVIWCKNPTHWERPWCWERLKAGGEGDSRGWDSWWHHRLDGHEFEWTPGVGDEQGGLACCDSWGRKELDTTEQLNCNNNKARIIVQLLSKGCDKINWSSSGRALNKCWAVMKTLVITEAASNTGIFSIPEPLSLARITTMERVSSHDHCNKWPFDQKFFFSNLILKITEYFWKKRHEEVGGLIPRELFMVDTTVGLAECLGSR